MRYFKWTMFALLALFLAGTGPATAQQKVLRVAQDANAPGLDPHMGSQFVLREISAHVFEGLVTIGEDYSVIPQLAESWTVSTDGLQYTFKLRSGVKFHNGKTMTADDVKASIDRFVQYSVRRGDVAAVQTVSVVDPLSVRITLKEAQGSFLGAMANPVSLLAIMPQEIVRGAKDALQPPNLIGTGPFRLAEWERDQRVILRRFADYSRDRRMPQSGLGGDREALVDEVQMISMLESATRFAALERGDVDYAITLAPSSYERLQTSTTMQPVIIKPYTQITVQLNANQPPFDNAKARQAVSRGLDMEAIMRAVTGSQPAFYRLQPSLFFPEQKIWHNTEGSKVYNTKNVELAKQLLRESGYDGKPVILLTNKDYEWAFRAALAAKPQLEAIGFKVEFQVRDWPGMVAQQKESKFNMATNGISTRPEPTGFDYLIRCRASWEAYGYCDPEMDKWLHAGVKAGDVKERAHAYTMAQRQFYETVPFVKIGDLFSLDGDSKSLKGYKVFFLRRFWNVTK